MCDVHDSECLAFRGHAVVDLDRRWDVREHPAIAPVFVEQPDHDADVHSSRLGVFARGP